MSSLQTALRTAESEREEAVRHLEARQEASREQPSVAQVEELEEELAVPAHTCIYIRICTYIEEELAVPAHTYIYTYMYICIRNIMRGTCRCPERAQWGR